MDILRRAFWIGLAIWLVCVPRVDAQTAESHLRQAETLYQEGRFKECLDACNRAIAINPDFSDAFRRRGLAQYSLSDHDRALEDLSRAIVLDPRNSRAYNGRSVVLNILRRYTESVRDADTALKIDPRYVNPYINRAQAKKMLKDVEGSRADLDAALKIEPDNISALNARGLFRRDAGDTAGAIADFDRAIAIAPASTSALLNRGTVRRMLGDLDGAIADASRVIELAPGDSGAYNNRGYYLMEKGDLAAARRDLDQALRLNPKYDLAAANLAKLDEKVAQTRTGAADTAARTSRTAETAVGGATSPEKTSAAAPALPAAGGPALPKVEFRADEDPCAAGGPPLAGLPWQAPDKTPVVLPPDAIPAVRPPVLDFKTMSGLQYNGAVSLAMEGMRLLYGEMTEEEEKRFQSCWAPLFDHPTEAAAEYLNRLNPLLGQYLAGRESFMRTAGAVQAAMFDAGLAVAADIKQGYIDALALTDQHVQLLRSLEAGLAEIARRIQALGNPPDPLAAKCEAAKRYRRALGSGRDTCPLEGIWASEDGNQTRFWTLYAYQPGLWLVYVVSWSEAERFRKFEGQVDLSRPGVVNVVVDGKTQTAMIPGIFDFLAVVESQPDGRLLMYQQPFGLVLQAFEFIMDGIADNTTYMPNPFNPAESSFVSDRFRRLDGIPPFLFPSHNEGNVLPVAEEGRQNKLNAFLAVKSRNARDIAAVLAGNAPRKPGLKAPAQPAPKPALGASAVPAAGEKEAREETIAFHRSVVELLNRNVQAEIDDLNKETDTTRRDKLALRVIQLRSDIQAEEDLIASYETGRIVRTRSAFDVMAHEMFVRKIEEDAVEVDATRRVAAGIERQFRLLPEEMRAPLREKARSILNAKTIAEGDLDKARKLAAAIDNQVQGYWQNVAAREDEKAIAAQEHEFYVNTAVMAAGTLTVGLGSAAYIQAFGETAAMAAWAPYIIGGIYGGATGAIAGGPVEGLKQSVAWASPIGFMGISFLEGYQHAAADPSSGLSDKLWAGAKQAGAGYVMGKAIQFGAGLTTKGALAIFGPKSRLFKPINWTRPTVRQQFADTKLRQDVSDAQSLIGLFQEKQTALLRAQQQNPAGSAQLRQLEAELKELAASLNSSYHCKLLLKYHTHPSIRRAFSRLVDKSYEEMMPEMIRRLKAQGYDVSNLRFKPLRNASSADSSSMDLDLALQETPGMVIRKNGRAVSLDEFQKDGQKCLNEAYHQVTGFSGTRSELALTTSRHQEAFANKKMLGHDADFGQFTAEEMASIGKVISVKVNKIENDPVLGEIAKMQSKCRESAKEIKNMMLKSLRQKQAKAKTGSPEDKQLQADIAYWEDMLKKFERIGTETTNPYEILQIEHSIRRDTGGKSSLEVINDLARSFGTR